MGCWNGTCGISQLPIMAGDPVLAYLIMMFQYEDENNFSGYCYPTGFASPLTFPIRAEYNDYGSIDNIKDNYVIDIIKKQFTDKIGNLTVEQWIDKEVERDKVTVEINRTIGEGEPRMTAQGIGLWMCHAWLPDCFRKIKNEWSREDFSLDEQLMVDAEKFWSDALRISELSPLFLWDCGGKDNLFGNMLFPMGIGSSLMTHRYWEPYREYVINLIKEKYPFDNVTVQELLKDLIDYQLMLSAMSSMRKGFAPRSGKGSQSEGFEYYRAMNLGMEKYMSTVDDERSKWDDEYESSIKS